VQLGFGRRSTGLCFDVNLRRTAMNIKLITATFPRDRLEAVEKTLQAIGVERIDASKVRGYGEYRNFYARNWMIDEVKLDIFTRTDEVESITTGYGVSLTRFVLRSLWFCNRRR
jgi:hypothetical protein